MKESLQVCRFTDYGADPNNPLGPENPNSAST